VVWWVVISDLVWVGVWVACTWAAVLATDAVINQLTTVQPRPLRCCHCILYCS
jgi:hypothetical protein